MSRSPATAVIALCFLGACRVGGSSFTASGSSHADSSAIRRDIAYLSSDALEGRGTGTPGNDSAAAYIAQRYAALGLRPAEPAFLQHFSARSVAAMNAGIASALPTQNVVAILRGSDPRLAGQYVVLGAHFDHLGRSSFGALDQEAVTAIRHGADDNASGTAAVLELGRLLARHPPRRSVVLANFTGEELGLLGSQYFVDHSPVPLDSVVAMLNFDMVGRLRSGRLLVYGVATATELPAIVHDANVATPLDLKALGDGYGPSDHSSFYARGIPVLHFFTDLHEDYHRASDVVDRIQAGGEARVVDYAERVTRSIADRPARLTFVRSAVVSTASSGSGSGYGPYFGSIPDMAAADVPGVRVTGVRAGSPADRAGLLAGDVIVEFGGTPVKDLYAYTDALRAHKVGDVVPVVVTRDGRRVTLTATLEARKE
ncbi:MAG: M28 family peptidase [Gemmatimonadaceae bacterium]